MQVNWSLSESNALQKNVLERVAIILVGFLFGYEEWELRWEYNHWKLHLYYLFEEGWKADE